MHPSWGAGVLPSHLIPPCSKGMRSECMMPSPTHELHMRRHIPFPMLCCSRAPFKGSPVCCTHAGYDPHVPAVHCSLDSNQDMNRVSQEKKKIPAQFCLGKSIFICLQVPCRNQPLRSVRTSCTNRKKPSHLHCSFTAKAARTCPGHSFWLIVTSFVEQSQEGKTLLLFPMSIHEQLTAFPPCSMFVAEI